MKKNHSEEHENQERWLVSYADFITLLFAFFVVLYATSSQNLEKEKKFEESVRTEFKMAAITTSINPTASAVSSGQVIEPIELFRQKNVDNAELEEYVVRLLKKNMSEEERKTAIEGIRHDNMGVRISLAASTFFPPGSAKLRLPALRSLDKVANILKISNKKIIIEGHTDDQVLAGSQIESNWELASLRATSVVRYLIKYHKIDPTRMAAISYADQRPLVDNTTESNREKNRRIEILIINSEDQD